MDAVLGRLKTCIPNMDAGGFRLTENPFFLKLCSDSYSTRMMWVLSPACICRWTTGSC